VQLEHALLHDRRKPGTKTGGQIFMYSILLVDDEADLLAAWHLILHAEGYEVRCAVNGVEALELMSSRTG
jgi:PleD family two-component response regulator